MHLNKKIKINSVFDDSIPLHRALHCKELL